ncbi:ATP-dependent nuclease [Cohnella sp. JJ-181]|uniref:ATP-dependent nuclease n=1 Tax=Cohnella rhizoplanae TaxID=2974897 RepID=UPI0022FF8997|nr:ATP-binding protein [Cohnella sp. JJ-181]CAI6086718.1 hypothetical protein COHCIP112018_05143 [Cohnella sp. JJ-181]
MDSRREINRIRDQYRAGQWVQFVEAIEIDGLRGWAGQTISFNFPIVAIAGENGSGKSTILKSIACAYENRDQSKTFYPSTFFFNTHWDKIEGVTLNYRIKRGDETRSFKISKPTARWSYPEHRYQRDVFILDISRTAPLDATAGYARIAKLAAGETADTVISEEYRTWLSYILGRPYENARFAKPDVDVKRDVGLLRREFGEISQFHQGAGEDATLDLIRSLQNIPSYSLLLIDEVEASLHPKAQRRLIRFLIWFCRQKKVQIILSTHSPYVLQELPRESRILLHPGAQTINVVYGVSPEFAMSRLDDDDHPDLHIFLEDREAEVLLREILLVKDPELIRSLDFLIVGPANVVQLMGKLASEKKLPYKGLGVVDSDTDETVGVIKLPGDGAPERVVFQDLKNANWHELPERFGIGAGTLFSILEDAMLEPDHHDWTTKIGDRIRVSKQTVWETLAKEWALKCLSEDEVNRVCSAIADTLIEE